MDHIATLPPETRADLFRETASRRNLSDAVVEKDFWVCWTLGRLFSDPLLSRKILFKGGTSLSKVFKLIERFSEDIDLILDWREITEEDPEAKRSKSSQAKFNKEIQEAAKNYLCDQLLPSVCKILGSTVGAAIASDDPNVISIAYPAAFSAAYIKPEIRLEIGPLAIWVPNAPFQISPYCAEEFPALFSDPTCHVQVIKAERTFWEKATILHHEAFRPEGSLFPARYSRHYYDLAVMAQSSVKLAALNDSNLDLLKSVVASKERFYPRGWARYDLARPGTMKLVPPAHVLSSLKRDYGEMQIMIYGDRPVFETIIEQIQALEIEINKLPLV
jgi:hypothetical protein